MDIENEPVLPYTPTHTGRRSRVGYLGMDGVDFTDLWPLFGGFVLSLALGTAFFVGGEWPQAGWLAKTVVALMPVTLGYAYLRFLVVGRPPHFKGDLWASCFDYQVDFNAPIFRAFPLIPRVWASGTAAGGPLIRREIHPLLRVPSGPTGDLHG